MKTDEFIISKTQQALDYNLVPYDLWATKAHILMLNKQKLIKSSATQNLLKALTEIEKEYNEGKFSIDNNLGLHLTIEAKVINKIDTNGYFMHTGKSRNDQIMTCELLYLKENIMSVCSGLIDIQKVLLDLGKKHIGTIMPGYTHMQPAKPTTFGQWSLSYLDMFTKCLHTLQYVFEKYDLCPLGAAESYGTSWNIDRKYTAALLGFLGVWEIPQEAISSRGFPQLAVLGVLKDIAIVISKVAADLLLFNTFEFGYIELPDELAKQMGSATGSSIMPQKKNPDVLELLRSTSPQIIGYESIIANILSSLPMGYNRDTREVKEYMNLGYTKTVNSLSMLTQVLKKININKDKMHKSVVDNYSLATDLTDYISQKSGIPYRKIYKLVGSLVKDKITKGIPITDIKTDGLQKLSQDLGINISLSEEELQKVLDPLVAISKRIHTGGSAPSSMKQLIKSRIKLIKDYSYWLKTKELKIKNAKIKTNEEIDKLLNQKGK